MNSKIVVGKSRLKCAFRCWNRCFNAPLALSGIVFGASLLTGCGGGSSGNDVGAATFRAAATFDVQTVGGEVAEIAAVTPDGNTLLYTDSETARIGFVNISNLAAVSQSGFYQGEGSPTSVATTRDNRFALAVFEGTNRLVALNIADRSVARTFNLPGQPDSIAVSPDGRYAAIAIENQRTDEDLPLPSSPPGSVVIVNLSADVAAWTQRTVALSLPSTLDFPTDPEPEFIDINHRNEAAVTLQENNGVAIINLASGSVTRYFSAGRTTHPADLKDDGAISFTDTLSNARRQPDGINWTPQGNLIIANEGDYNLDAPDEPIGGRNFSILSPTGAVIFDENGALEQAVAAAGRYDDRRSDARGVEVENVEVGRFGGRSFAFVAMERADSLGVYRLENDAAPQFVQVLPTGDAPEGIVAVPQRNLVITANEGDGTLSFFTL